MLWWIICKKKWTKFGMFEKSSLHLNRFDISISWSSASLYMIFVIKMNWFTKDCQFYVSKHYKNTTQSLWMFQNSLFLFVHQFAKSYTGSEWRIELKLTLLSTQNYFSSNTSGMFCDSTLADLLILSTFQIAPFLFISLSNIKKLELHKKFVIIIKHIVN